MDQHASLLRREFVLDPDTLYLNHAAVAPWPTRTAQAVNRFAEQNLHFGARYYAHWNQQEAQLREQLRALINAAHTDDIALLKNTSEGLSVIASGLNWSEGDEIIISDQEFPSNRIPWEALRDRGVRVVPVSLAGEDPEGNLINAMSPATRLLSISSVQYGSGLKLDMGMLGRACRERDILFCVDAIQSLGAEPLDARAIHADFVVADGHKWLLGPEGLALFYCHAGVRERLALHQFGWHMIEHAGDYDRKDWRPAASARRFECGSPNMLGIHALSASLSLFEEIGMPQVTQALSRRVQQILDGLAQAGDIRVISPLSPGRRAGIVTFVPARESAQACYRRLMDAGVVCALRGGGVRWSPHFYTPPEVIERALQILFSGSPPKAGEQ